MDFKTIKLAVAKQFEQLAKGAMFRTDVDKDALWDTYLASFPPGTNPVFRERTEHDCQCCKQFIRAVGNTVAIIGGRLVSIWDFKIDDPAYQAVADAMAAFVKSKPIADEFLHYEKTAGTDVSRIDNAVSGRVESWSHFFVNIPSVFVKPGKDIGTELNKSRTGQQVLKRALDELTPEAVTTVLDLISQNAIYRGAEFKAVVQEFQKLQYLYADVEPGRKDLVVWGYLQTVSGAVVHIRNSAIGTLLIDLSADVELEDAVKKFESSVMAPSNYKRPTALVSKAMIEKAKQTVAELGLGSALERRYATIEDITVNNILYANRSARKSLQADVFDDLAAKVPVKTKSLDKAEDVPIERFVSEILPRAQTIELMVENRHASSLVSLVTAVDPTARQLFKWANPFSWSYNGDVADAIKDRVKRAGGRVEGDLCCRLAWDYTDDLDFHMVEPSGYEIYFGNRRRTSSCGGVLDVDANGADGLRVDPVENIVYEKKSLMKDGVYVLVVNNFSRRSSGVGFEVEIEFDGAKHNIVYEKVVRDRENVTVAKIKYTKAAGFEIIESLPASKTSKTFWGLNTQTFVPVNVLMQSPNHWDDRSVGNKHWFFMLEGCRNEGVARGFYNEFLTEELTAHRKVIETVGSKMKTEESVRQLSGLGFSSTARNSVLCKVTGSFSRVINLVF